VFSTYLGGKNGEAAWGVALGSADSIFVVGQTNSTDFLTTDGSRLAGDYDVFLTGISGTGVFLQSGYFGGEGFDSPFAVAVDVDGSVCITGVTKSTRFPKVPSSGGGFSGGNWDGFVAKLAPGGTTPIYSRYLGGSGDDYAQDVGIDGAGRVFVVGTTYSGDFPTLNPLQPVRGLLGEGFVSWLDPTGSLLYSSYLGGSGEETAVALASRGGHLYVVGSTASADFPVVAPFQSTLQGTSDAFVARMFFAAPGAVVPAGGPAARFALALALVVVALAGRRERLRT
jgi:hypothetical protein